MRGSLHLVLLIFYFSLVAAENFNNFFSKDFKFDQIEFPTELRQSSFNVRPRVRQRGQFERASEALFAVAVRLKSLLDFRTNGGNFLVSPLSVAAAVGQLLLGAKGESRRRLSEILSTAKKDGAGSTIPDVEYHRQFKTMLSLLETSASEKGDNEFENYELHVASAFFIQPNLHLRPDYKHAVTDFYNCDVVPLNFSGNPVAAQRTVNEWVNRNTRGHVPSLLPYPLPPTTASLVANAVYFQGAWESPFDPEYTISGTFNINSKERVAVSYMRGQFELRYAESKSLGCQMVVLPYKHKQASMYIFLPFDKNNDIRNFTAAISVSDIVELKRTSIERSVTLVMPKMTLTGRFSLKEPLIRLQKLQQAAAISRGDRRPTAVRSRVKRDTRVYENKDNSPTITLLKEKVDDIKRHIRGIKSENSSSSANTQHEISKIDVNFSKSEANEKFENKFSDSRTASKTGSDAKQADKILEQSIKTEIITSSIMIPALPLIVMEVDKTYTIRLNNSYPSLNNNYSNSLRETFHTRQGEFDPNFQITSPLLSNFKPPNYPTYHVNSPRPINKPQLGVRSSSRPVDGNTAYDPKDRITFPEEESSTDRRLLRRTTISPQTTYHPIPLGNRPGFFQPPESFESPSDSSSVNAPSKHTPLTDSGASKPAVGVQMDDIQFDLTGASDDSRFRIDDIIHQMWLEVTEKGTEAAAVSAGAVDYSGGVKLVLVDRPFLFVILHEATRATLFWGAIVDPTGGAGLRTEGPLGAPPSAQSSVVHSTGR